MSYKSPPLAVVTSGHQPLLRRAVAGQEGPVWLITDDPRAAIRAAGRDDIECLELPRGRGFARAAQLALQLASDRGHGAVVLLKGSPTVIVSPDGPVWINGTGNEGMATAGMGDVLTGVITGFAAQGLDVSDACALGAFVHGLAGDDAAEDMGMHGMVAGDVLDLVPLTLNRLAAMD